MKQDTNKYKSLTSTSVGLNPPKTHLGEPLVDVYLYFSLSVFQGYGNTIGVGKMEYFIPFYRLFLLLTVYGEMKTTEITPKGECLHSLYITTKIIIINYFFNGISPPS